MDSDRKQDVERSRLQLAKLCNIDIPNCRDNIYIQKNIFDYIFAGDNINVNCEVTVIEPRVERLKKHLKKCSVLHLMYAENFDVELFDMLLERGADFTLKNDSGQTVVHWIISDCFCYKHETFIKLATKLKRLSKQKTRISFIKSVMKSHVKYQNSTNPQDDNGISHLHGACIANHIESLNLFLDNGASTDEAVNFNSPDFPGYTPLHFAAKFDSFEAARVLVNRGANVNAKNAKRLTPLDICVKRRFDALNSLANNPLTGKCGEDWRRSIRQNEETIKLLTGKNVMRVGKLTMFQLACSFEDLTIAKSLLSQVDDINHRVPLESPFCAGYTAAHFAVLGNIEAVKMLAKLGANMCLEGDDGRAALDICMIKYSGQDLLDILILSSHQTNLDLSHGKLQLSDILSSMSDVNQFRLFLDRNSARIAQASSSSWTSCASLLHAVVTFSTEDEAYVKECLEHGLDMNVKNSRGQTPLHLAFRQGKSNIFRVFIDHLYELNDVVDLADEDNLTYLHIACFSDFFYLVEKLLLNNADPNVAYTGKRILCAYHFEYRYSFESGWTALHAATVEEADSVAEILLCHGANLHAIDDRGLTPIHWLSGKIYSAVPEIYNVLFSSLLNNPTDRIVESIGLSYLHIASYAGRVDVAQKLLELGSDANAVINHTRKYSVDDDDDHHHDDDLMPTFLTFHAMFTPLNCAAVEPTLKYFDSKIFNVLLHHDADTFITFFNNPRNSICSKIIHNFMDIVWDIEELQKNLEARWGLTKLHVACSTMNNEAIETLLGTTLDVNVKVHEDSAIFPGCTPLHLLLTINNFNHFQWKSRMNKSMIKLLVDSSADVTIVDANNDTPIHVLCKGFKIDLRRGEDYIHALLNAQSDFEVNPVNDQGLSHFHIACYFHEVEVVEKFLKNSSIGINQPIDFFAEFNAGSTPLHLALSHSKIPDGHWTKVTQTVDLLLKYGANVDAEDVYGETPLHKPAALRSPNMIIFEKLVSHGANMHSENTRGEMPLTKLSCTNWSGYAKICQKYDCQAKRWNRITEEAFIGKLLVSRSFLDSLEMEEFLKLAEMNNEEEMGRTAVHSIVAVSYNFLYDVVVADFTLAIGSFINRGIDVNHQDELGRTALHYAAIVQNRPATEVLLRYGADVNITDNDGNSAFFYATLNLKYYQLCSSYTASKLYLHIRKLRYLTNIEISQLNRNCARRYRQILGEQHTILYRYLMTQNEKLPKNFCTQVNVIKKINIGVRSWTLFDLLSDTGVISVYPYLPKNEQEQIAAFCKLKKFNQFDHLVGIIELQFCKISTRLKLIEPALTSLRTILGFSLPGLCEEIAMFLTNNDLKNLIASVSFKHEKH